MSLFTKCILSEREVSDGVRISVMSRHTLSDGITPDLRIKLDLFDEHLPQLAPNLKLIGDYYKRNLPWDEFEKQYLQQLHNPKFSSIIENLIQKALQENITLLCIEKSPDKCHRRLLAEKIQRLESRLVIKIN